MEADYQLRVQIKNKLESMYHQNANTTFASHLALQVAFCYSCGFGVEADADLSKYWVEKCSDTSFDLEGIIGGLNPSIQSKQSSWIVIEPSELAQEYRRRYGKDLEEIARVYEREARDMGKAFGQAHHVPLVLGRMGADIFDELGDLQASKKLRTEMAMITETAYGQDHEEHRRSLNALVTSHLKLGDFQKARNLGNVGLRGLCLHAAQAGNLFLLRSRAKSIQYQTATWAKGRFAGVSYAL